MNRFPRPLVAFALAWAAVPALGQEPAPLEETRMEQTALEMRAGQVIALINGEIMPEDVFTDGFLAALPAPQFQTVSDQLTSQFGAAVAIEELGTPGSLRSTLAVRMERAIARGGIAIDPDDENRVSELLFQSFEKIDDTKEKIEADLAALPGTTNALFAPLDDLENPVFAHNAQQSLALGSTFKMYVLSALTGAISRGELDWDTVVLLDQKSLPSGQLQNWPEGSPVTVHTLATLMISISDNTATDQLMEVLGREAVEAELVASGNSDPSRTLPFLTTRQLFAMRGVSDETVERYRAAEDAGQRAIIDELGEEDVSEDRIQQVFASNTPGAIDIEWFASPRDLAGLLDRLAADQHETARAIMSINTHLPDRIVSQWDYVGYKGGSEPGVLNLTWLLRDDAGNYWIATVGSNDPEAPVELATLETIARRILALPR
jgi:beta-lactamase class A